MHPRPSAKLSVLADFETRMPVQDQDPVDIHHLQDTAAHRRLFRLLQISTPALRQQYDLSGLVGDLDGRRPCFGDSHAPEGSGR